MKPQSKITPHLETCTSIVLPKISDPRGNLSFVESRRHVPFDLQRVFYLYDVPSGADRGGHALKLCHQVLIAIAGSFDVILRDGVSEQRIQLNKPHIGLHIPPLVWREMDNFSSGSVCLVFASEKYSEDDYYRSYEAYIAAIAGVQ